MTRKDYELIAGIFNDFQTEGNSSAQFNGGKRFAHRVLSLRLADAFERENVRFDRVRFLKASGHLTVDGMEVR